jgi:hypothetical protein
MVACVYRFRSPRRSSQIDLSSTFQASVRVDAARHRQQQKIAVISLIVEVIVGTLEE